VNRTALLSRPLGGLDGLLACPVHHTPTTRRDASYICDTCGEVGHIRGPVRCFELNPDPFYEGRYKNRTKFIPKNDGFWATLPLAIVLQGYPTAVARALPANSTVLELGCAGGVAWFGKRYRMVGLDLSSDAIPLASHDYALLIQGDATKIPLQDRSVTGVISSCFFEHFDDEGKARILRECRRVIRPGGKVVFYYDIWTENFLISAYRRTRPEDYEAQFLNGDGHIGYAVPSHNEQLFRDAGFMIEYQTFHERTPILTNSCWQKFSSWPGLMGAYAKLNRALTAGAFWLPSLALIAVMDKTVGRLCPYSHARCVTTIARAP